MSVLPIRIFFRRERVACAVATAVRLGQAVGGRTETGEGPCPAGPTLDDEPLQGTPLEPAVPAGRREGGDAALIGPAPQGVRVDAEQPA